MIWIIAASVIILLLPIIGMGIATKFGMNLFQEPEFWYAYMSYFGTVILGAVAVWQNKNAQKENSDLQKIMAQKSLPIVKVESLKSNHSERAIIDNSELPSKNLYSIARVPVMNISESEGDEDDVTLTYISVPTIDVNVDVDKNAVFQKRVSFEIKNVAEAFIRHIAIDNIEVKGYKGYFNFIMCSNNIKGNGVSELLSSGDTIKVKMNFFFNDEQKKELWDNIQGGIGFTMYLTNTSINGIKFHEYVSIDIRDDGYCKISYGERFVKTD